MSLGTSNSYCFSRRGLVLIEFLLGQNLRYAVLLECFDEIFYVFILGIQWNLIFTYRLKLALTLSF